MVTVKPDQMDFRITPVDVKKFPLDLNNHMMVFSFKTYLRSNVFQPTKINLQRSIALPIPANLSDSVQLQWVEGENAGALTEATLRAVGAGGEGNKSFFEKVGDALSGRGGNPFEGGATFASAVVETASLSLPGGVGASRSTFTGTAINPNVALVFKGQTGTREFTFTWKLIPDSAAEHEMIRDIIREFRFQAVPKKQSNADFLIDYPNQVNINIFGVELGYLPFYKTAVVTAVEVNYTPDGIPVFMRKSGAPAAVTLTITVKETTQLFKDDIDRLDPLRNRPRLLTFNETDVAEALADKRETEEAVGAKVTSPGFLSTGFG